jgi:hypothetical protein
MDLTTELEKKVYASADRLVGTQDTLLNTAVKATLLADELTDETLEFIIAKLRRDNQIFYDCAMNELHFDACGNELREPEKIGDNDIDADASSNIGNILQQPEGGETKV